MHETSYTVGDKIIGLRQQLLLLRLALVRSIENYCHYPDLFRALRVLIIDGDRGRLGELARLVGETHTVQSRAFVHVEARDSSSIEKVRSDDKVVLPRNGLESLFLPNYYSRWFGIRGIDSSPEKSSNFIDFWNYIESDVVAFMPEWGAEVTRQRLIAEVCNTRDVAHSSNNYPTFLHFTNAFGVTAPYFLEIAEDVAYEVLLFGKKVLGKCIDQFKTQVAQSLQSSIPVPALVCHLCQMPLEIDQFICSNCNSLQLPPPQRIGFAEQISSVFRFGRLLEKPVGSLPIKFHYMLLAFNNISEYTFVDITDGDSRMLLKRLGDMKLLWCVDRGVVSHSAVWDITKMPKENSVVVTLIWSPDQVKIISTVDGDGLWEVSSDGIFRKIG